MITIDYGYVGSIEGGTHVKAAISQTSMLTGCMGTVGEVTQFKDREEERLKEILRTNIMGGLDKVISLHSDLTDDEAACLVRLLHTINFSFQFLPE
jgi:hypothetical protein